MSRPNQLCWSKEATMSGMNRIESNRIESNRISSFSIPTESYAESNQSSYPTHKIRRKCDRTNSHFKFVGQIRVLSQKRRQSDRIVCRINPAIRLIKFGEIDRTISHFKFVGQIRVLSQKRRQSADRVGCRVQASNDSTCNIDIRRKCDEPQVVR
jgi:hypothetical protein